MNRFIFLHAWLILICALPGFNALAQTNRPSYLFSYFKNNGEDGLHLAASEDGLKWKALFNDSAILKPVVGEEKLMRDPCIIFGRDGNFHMVWSASWAGKGIGYASSKDLVHWSEQRFLPLMAHEADAKNCWAPEITYDERADRYMIYWATTISGRFPATDTGGDNNHRMYYVTTRDFTDFTTPKLLYDKGFNVIDATVVPNVNRYMMFLKDETLRPPAKNIRLATADKITGPYSEPSAPITGNYWAEGPTVLRMPGKWIVYFDKYMLHSMGAVESADGRHWKDISDQLTFPKGTRHGTVFTVTPQQRKNLEAALQQLQK